MKKLLILSFLLLTGCSLIGAPQVVAEVGKTSRVAVATTGAVIVGKDYIAKREARIDRQEQAIYDNKKGAWGVLIADKIAWIFALAIVIAIGAWLARGVIFYWIDKRRRV